MYQYFDWDPVKELQAACGYWANGPILGLGEKTF